MTSHPPLYVTARGDLKMCTYRQPAACPGHTQACCRCSRRVGTHGCSAFTSMCVESCLTASPECVLMRLLRLPSCPQALQPVHLVRASSSGSGPRPMAASSFCSTPSSSCKGYVSNTHTQAQQSRWVVGVCTQHQKALACRTSTHTERMQHLRDYIYKPQQPANRIGLLLPLQHTL